MLLHSDLKGKKFDPKLTILNSSSISPIRSFENAVGGGKMLSMKPTFIPPGSYVIAHNSPYKSMFNLPKSNMFDKTLIYNDDAMKENIEVAIKKYLLEEREIMKYELVKDALKEIQEGLNSK